MNRVRIRAITDDTLATTSIISQNDEAESPVVCRTLHRKSPSLCTNHAIVWKIAFTGQVLLIAQVSSSNSEGKLVEEETHNRLV